MATAQEGFFPNELPIDSVFLWIGKTIPTRTKDYYLSLTLFLVMQLGLT